MAVTPSTSYAMSLAARNVHMRPGQRAVVLWDQMASNVMPWQDVGFKIQGLASSRAIV